VNAKLTPHVSSSIGGQLATSKLSIDRSDSSFLVDAEDPLGHAIRCIRQLEFNEELHFLETHPSLSLRPIIIVWVDTDIKRKFIMLGVWIGLCIDQLQFGSECCRCRDL